MTASDIITASRQTPFPTCTLVLLIYLQSLVEHGKLEKLVFNPKDAENFLEINGIYNFSFYANVEPSGLTLTVSWYKDEEERGEFERTYTEQTASDILNDLQAIIL